MIDLISEYSKAFEDELKLDFELAFSDECPPEQAALWESDKPACYQLAPMMLEAGVSNWGHLGWWKDILFTFQDWQDTPSGLIKCRLYAEWLLGTLPANHLDPDVAPKLEAIASGDFCTAFEGATSIWPKKAEHYLKTLNWQMLEYSLDAAANDRATAQAWIFQRTGKIV